MKILQICPPPLSDVATLPWEIQKSHFSTLLFIYFRLFTLSQKKTNNNCCTAVLAVAVYLLLFSASYYLHSPSTAPGARYRRSACIDMDMLRLAAAWAEFLHSVVYWCQIFSRAKFFNVPRIIKIGCQKSYPRNRRWAFIGTQCTCVLCQLASQRNEADETVRLMASKLMQSRTGSLVPMKSAASAAGVKLSLTQQFNAAGIFVYLLVRFWHSSRRGWQGLCNGTVSVCQSCLSATACRCSGFAAEVRAARRARCTAAVARHHNSTAHSSTAYSSRCGQWHVVSWRRKLNTDSLLIKISLLCAEIVRQKEEEGIGLNCSVNPKVWLSVDLEQLRACRTKSQSDSNIWLSKMTFWPFILVHYTVIYYFLQGVPKNLVYFCSLCHTKEKRYWRKAYFFRSLVTLIFSP